MAATCSRRPPPASPPGAALSDAGPAVDPATLVRLPDPVVAVGDGWLEAEVMTVDRFGNVQLAADGATLAGLGAELLDRRQRAGPARDDVRRTSAQGELLVYEDSAGRVAVAVNGGRAVVVLSVRPGDVVRIAQR